MECMTDVMVDLETTGTDPGHNAIIQIAAVQFNFNTGAIGPVFNRCLSVAPRRYWDEKTRVWWGKNPRILNSIVERMETPEEVLRDFLIYATTNTPKDGFRLWGKPIHFEFPFLDSYFSQFGLPMPFFYRIARDLNTYVAAQLGGADHHDMAHIETPNAHDALADVVHQLKILFAAKDKDFGPIDAEFEEITQ